MLYDHLTQLTGNRYIQRPKSVVNVWSKTSDVLICNRYAHILTLESCGRYRVELNSAFLQQYLPDCVLTVLTLDDPNNVEMDQLTADDLVALHDLFGYETPHAHPFVSQISDKDYEDLAHYLNLMPFHLARYLDCQPLKWFKPYEKATGLFHYTHEQLFVLDRDKRFQPYANANEHMAFEHSYSCQVVELKSFVCTLTPEDLQRWENVNARSIVPFVATQESVEFVMEMRFWSCVVPKLMASCHDPFLSIFILDNLTVLRSLARNADLWSFRSHAVEFRHLCLATCRRYDTLLRMCDVFTVRHLCLRDRVQVIREAVRFTTLYETQQLFQSLKLGCHFSSHRENDRLWDSLLQNGADTDNYRLIEDAAVCRRLQHHAVKLILAQPKLQHLATTLVLDVDFLTTLWRYMQHVPVREADQFSGPLLDVMASHKSLMVGNQVRYLIGLSHHESVWKSPLHDKTLFKVSISSFNDARHLLNEPEHKHAKTILTTMIKHRYGPAPALCALSDV